MEKAQPPPIYFILKDIAYIVLTYKVRPPKRLYHLGLWILILFLIILTVGFSYGLY